MSVDFDPVKLRPNRRRIDPVVVGIVVVVLAVTAAVIKPWDNGEQLTTVPTASVGPAVALTTAAPTSGPVGLVQQPVQAPGPPPPSWSDLAPAVSDHTAWGVAAVVLGSQADSDAPTATSYLELWSPSVVDGAGVENAYVARAQESIVALGVTVPAAESPEDVRIWRVHDDDGLEWVDAQLVTGPTAAGTLLMVQPGSGGAAFTSWAGGQYRIDVLVAGGIHRIALQIPARFGNVPPPDAWPAPPADLVAAKDGDPSVTRQGPFATVDGVSVGLSAAPGPPLDEAAEWRASLAAAGSRATAVAAVHLARTTGLGLMFTEHAAVESASIVRLAPDALADEVPVIGGVSSFHGRTPYVVFTPVGGGAWAPGVYAISAAWTDPAGEHAQTWHVELRPGVRGGGSAASVPGNGG